LLLYIHKCPFKDAVSKNIFDEKWQLILEQFHCYIYVWMFLFCFIFVLIKIIICFKSVTFLLQTRISSLILNNEIYIYIYKKHVFLSVFSHFLNFYTDYICIQCTVKPSHVVTSIKQPPVLSSHLFLVLS
jgi:hypothetical protein